MSKIGNEARLILDLGKERSLKKLNDYISNTEDKARQLSYQAGVNMVLKEMEEITKNLERK